MIWHSLIEPRKLVLPKPEDALAGRPERMPVPARHAVSGAALEPPFPDGTERAVFGMGCFWGAERKLWETPGVHTTAAGYAGGFTPNPTYQEVCSGQTGHTEVVLAVFRIPIEVSFERVAAAVLGGARPDAGHAPGERRRHAVPLGRLLLLGRPAADLPKRRGTRIRRSWPPRGMSESARKSSRPASSTTPRITTSSTSPRIRSATAASGVPASPARPV